MVKKECFCEDIDYFNSIEKYINNEPTKYMYVIQILSHTQFACTLVRSVNFLFIKYKNIL